MVATIPCPGDRSWDSGSPGLEVLADGGISALLGELSEFTDVDVAYDIEAGVVFAVYGFVLFSFGRTSLFTSHSDKDGSPWLLYR